MSQPAFSFFLLRRFVSFCFALLCLPVGGQLCHSLAARARAQSVTFGCHCAKLAENSRRPIVDQARNYMMATKLAQLSPEQPEWWRARNKKPSSAPRHRAAAWRRSPLRAPSSAYLTLSLSLARAPRSQSAICGALTQARRLGLDARRLPIKRRRRRQLGARGQSIARASRQEYANSPGPTLRLEWSRTTD